VPKNDYYIEQTPIEGYRWAPPSAYETFQDAKFGIRITGGSIPSGTACGVMAFSQVFARGSPDASLYKPWNPVGSDPDGWMNTFQSGMKTASIGVRHPLAAHGRHLSLSNKRASVIGIQNADRTKRYAIALQLGLASRMTDELSP
jgi:hypothetical protein